MPPKGSSSQSSTLVARGGTGGAVAPRAPPSGATARRRSTRSTAARPGYFYAEDSSLFQLSPDQVMYFAIGFIMVVMLLHIVGKKTLLRRRWSPTTVCRGAQNGSSSAETANARTEAAIPVHVSQTAEAAAATAPARSFRRFHSQRTQATSPSSHQRQTASTTTTPKSEYMRGIPTGIDLASTSAAATMSAAARPPPPAHLRFFMIGAAAAVATHYLVDFIGTLPLVRYLVRRFIWQGRENQDDIDSANEKNGSTSDKTNNGFTGVEADEETVEWVNMCWRKAWRIYQRGLERWLAGLLQPVFDNLVADGMVPRFVQRLRIAEFTLDHEAPYFSNMRRRNSRKDSDLTGVVDVRYTGGARMLLLIECGTGKWRIKVPVMVSDLDLECSMWLKLRLAPMCPYVGTVSLAFVGPPAIKVQLSPYNRVRLMRIPILQPFLSKLFTVDLPDLITLPRRLEINIPPAVTAVAEAAVGRDAVMRAVASAVLQADALEHALISALPLGPQGAAGGISLPDLFQGELQVVLKEARNLPVWGFPWQSNPYCRILLGSQAVRSRRDSETSQASTHRAPVWNQEFQFLVEDPTVQTLDILIGDSPITGRTEVGRARLQLADLPTDRSTLDVWLPVESSMPGESTQGAVHLSLTYRPFQDDDGDSGFREAKAWAKSTNSQDEFDSDGNPISQITDVKSAADASSRAAVAASAAAAAVAVTKAAAARAAARLARAARGEAAAAAAVIDAAADKSSSISDGEDSDDSDISGGGGNNNGGNNNGGNNNGGINNGNGASISSNLLLPPPLELKLVQGSRDEEDDGNVTLSSTILSKLPSATDPAAREEAVAQLETLAATMQQLTQDVHELNSAKSRVPGADAAAAEAAAKAVAAAEALAVTAVVAGDVRAANAALQKAAAALEQTAVKLAKENASESSSNGNGNGSGNSIITTESEKQPVVVTAIQQTPEERAAAALAAAQAAAAAAAAAVAAAAAQDPASHPTDIINRQDGLISLSLDEDDLIASLAADAIPSATLNSSLSNGVLISTDLDEIEDQQSASSSSSQSWWSRALELIPGVPAAHDSAADAVAEADGGAAIITPSSRQSSSSGSSSSKTNSASKDERDVEIDREDGSSSSLKKKDKKKKKKNSSEKEEELAAAATASIDGPVGDIIISPDLPLEEIAAEVQKSWKMRDVHVENMLQKAVASQQRRSERPWLVMTSVMATASAVLLCIVLYRLYNGQ